MLKVLCIHSPIGINQNRLFDGHAWKVMRLIAIFLFAACMQVCAKGYTQTVSLQERNATLETVFQQLKKQTGLPVLYTRSMLKDSKRVTVNFKNVSLQFALDEILKDQGLDYSIVNNTVVIKVKEATTPKEQNPNTLLQDVTIEVSGKVTDAEGNPLEGATVTVKGTSTVTKTNASGFFLLKNVDENASLEISYAEHETVLVKVNNRSVVNISLKRAEANLQEVIINKGYYTEKQRYSLSNVGKVTSKDIEKQSISNPLQAIVGKVPGIYIQQGNGLANGGFRVRVQGENSIRSGGDPLYVIDGVPYLSSMPNTAQRLLDFGMSGGTYNSGLGGGNPLAFINPADIESMEILKDADATAIYGSRAANGAILITTKRGKAGKMNFDVKLERGWGKNTNFLKMMNTQQYLEMRREGKRNAGASINSTDYDINGTWDTTRYTDWQRVLAGNTSERTLVNASLSGGTNTTQYLLSGTYQKQTDVFPGDYSDKKSTLHFNINNRSADNRFRLDFTGSYLYDHNTLPGGAISMENALQLAPNAPALFNPDGSLNWAPDQFGTSSWYNPLAQNYYSKYKGETQNIVSNIQANYKLTSTVGAKVSAGYNRLTTNESNIGYLNRHYPENRANATRDANFANSSTQLWIIEPEINFGKTFNEIHKITASAGMTIQENKAEGSWVTGKGFVSDELIYDLKAAPIVTVLDTEHSEYKYSAVYGRVNYILSDRYIVNITGRRDGSSRFGYNNRFQNFASIAGGWIFSEESFIKKSIPVLSYGKVTLSYGTTGSDQIGNYRYLSLYTTYSSGVTNIAYQGIPALYPAGLANPDLKWELTKKLRMGIELNFLKDRISTTANYTINRSSNQLLSAPLPSITGFQNVDENLAATVENTSLEIGINTRNIEGKNFTWSSSFNLTVTRNKLLKFPGLANTSYNGSFEVGQPIDRILINRYLGVDPLTGLYLVADRNGNPTSTPTQTDKLKSVSRTIPRYYGGLSNSFTYKAFQLDILISFTRTYISNFFGGNGIPGFGIQNHPASVLDRWQRPGDIATYQRFSSTTAGVNAARNGMNSSDIKSNLIAYGRVRNVALSFDLPERISKKIGLRNCTAMIKAQNLFTFSGLEVLDPETGDTAVPPLKIIEAGLKISIQ